MLAAACGIAFAVGGTVLADVDLGCRQNCEATCVSEYDWCMRHLPPYFPAEGKAEVNSCLNACLAAPGCGPSEPPDGDPRWDVLPHDLDAYPENVPGEP